MYLSYLIKLLLSVEWHKIRRKTGLLKMKPRFHVTKAIQQITGLSQPKLITKEN